MKPPAHVRCLTPETEQLILSVIQAMEAVTLAHVAGDEVARHRADKEYRRLLEKLRAAGVAASNSSR